MQQRIVVIITLETPRECILILPLCKRRHYGKRPSLQCRRRATRPQFNIVSPVLITTISWISYRVVQQRTETTRLELSTSRRSPVCLSISWLIHKLFVRPFTCTSVSEWPFCKPQRNEILWFFIFAFQYWRTIAKWCIIWILESAVECKSE